jgi:hypothetical protein
MLTAGTFLVSARGGGGIGASNDLETFQTEAGGLTPATLFVLGGLNANGTSTIKTATGNFVTAVGGGSQATRAFHTDATVASTWEQFYIAITGDVQDKHFYAIRPTNAANPARFLTALGGGNRLVHAMAVTPVMENGSLFLLIGQTDGTFALRTANLVNYVTADDGGGLAHGTPQLDNLITTKTVPLAWERFRIQETSTGVYTIQTVSGFYIAVKNDFTNISTRISFPDQAPEIGYTATFELLRSWDID